MKKLTLLLSALLFSGCACLPRNDSAMIHHIVLCWLKDSGNAEHRAAIIKTSKTFTEIPGVVDVDAGEVVMSDREIVDDSFDVAIAMTFASVEDMNAYIVHPRHKAAVKSALLPLVSRIVVYDFTE